MTKFLFAMGPTAGATARWRPHASRWYGEADAAYTLLGGTSASGRTHHLRPELAVGAFIGDDRLSLEIRGGVEFGLGRGRSTFESSESAGYLGGSAALAARFTFD